MYTFKICSTLSSPSLEELSNPLIGSTCHQQKVLIHWFVDSLYCGCRQRMYFHFMLLLGIAISDCQCFFIFEKRVQFLEFSLNPIVFCFFFFFFFPLKVLQCCASPHMCWSQEGTLHQRNWSHLQVLHHDENIGSD